MGTTRIDKMQQWEEVLVAIFLSDRYHPTDANSGWARRKDLCKGVILALIVMTEGRHMDGVQTVSHQCDHVISSIRLTIILISLLITDEQRI